jgi:HK97 family phage prohead protease
MENVKSWSILEVKSVSEDSRVIRGIASTPTTDRAGDIVEPKGAKFKLPFPLLNQHNHDQPIGHVTSAKVTDKGIEIEASIAKDTGLDYVDRAWAQIKAGLVRGLSIGFRAMKAEPVDAEKPWKGIRFKEWELFELSAVTIPCNAECNISAVKKYDAEPVGENDRDALEAKLQKNLRINRAKQAIIAAKRTIKRK